MARKHAKQDRGHLVVSLRHVAAPDADTRISRAFDILLDAAARKNTPESEAGPKDQRQDRPSGDNS